jgi:hypothetical protein
MILKGKQGEGGEINIERLWQRYGFQLIQNAVKKKKEREKYEKTISSHIGSHNGIRYSTKSFRC